MGRSGLGRWSVEDALKSLFLKSVEILEKLLKAVAKM